MNRLLKMNVATGSFAGVGFSKATGSSVPIKDGGSSDERAGIIRSAAQSDFAQYAPDLSSSDETFKPLTDTDFEYIVMAASTPQTGDIPSRSWNIGDLGGVYDLPKNARLTIDNRKIVIAPSLISAIILTRSAQELFPDVDQPKILKISKLILYQIGKYSNAKNRSESDEFPELPALMSTDRKLLRRIVTIYCSALIGSRKRSLFVIDNLSNTAMIVHDLFAQDDAAMEDA